MVTKSRPRVAIRVMMHLCFEDGMSVIEILISYDKTKVNIHHTLLFSCEIFEKVPTVEA